MGRKVNLKGKRNYVEKLERESRVGKLSRKVLWKVKEKGIIHV